MKVQVQPCKDLEDCVVRCSTSEANYFGVYIGEPGDYRWIADFASVTDAHNWAREVAQNNDCTVEDLC